MVAHRGGPLAFIVLPASLTQGLSLKLELSDPPPSGGPIESLSLWTIIPKFCWHALILQGIRGFFNSGV